MQVLQQLAYHQQQSQAYLAQLAGVVDGYGDTKAGAKRGYGDESDDFDSFLSDMKKRKLAPTYDDGTFHSLLLLIGLTMQT